jgi:transposase InsO family protein
MESGGIDALIDASRRKQQVRVSNELRKRGIFISPSGVRSVWLRRNLESFKKRLSALERHVAETGQVLTEAQVVALEKKQDDDVAHGEIETAHPGYLGSQDTFYVGTIKGVGRIYQQTFVDTYSKWAAAKLYTTKTPLTDLLNDRVLPFLAEQGMGLIRVLTDRGTEYCGKPETHDYQLYLAINDIEHSRTKANHPQTNGICERFHKTILQEFYQVAFRRKIYRSIEELQIDLDDWLHSYNHDRTHQGKMCCGRTPMQTLIDGKEAWHDKITALNN